MGQREDGGDDQDPNDHLLDEECENELCLLHSDHWLCLFCGKRFVGTGSQQDQKQAPQDEVE